MQRIGIDYHLVADAAEKLTAQGEVPTIDRVRVFLGSTGSNTTISKYLHQWRNNTAHGNKPESAYVVTPPDPVQQVVNRVWQQLREETDAEIEAIKTNTQSLITESEEKVAHLANECEKLTALNIDYKEQIRALDAKTAMQHLDLNKLQREHDLLQERNNGLMQRYADLELMMSKQQNDLVRAHHVEMNLVIEKSNAQLSALEKIIDQQKCHAEEQHEKLMQEVDHHKMNHQKVSKDYELLQSVTAVKDLELIELKSQLAALKNEIDILSLQLQNQEKYWGYFESNSQVTKNILSELKEIPKIDFGSSCINMMNDIQSNINFSMDDLGKVTRDMKQAIESFKDFSMNTGKKK